MITLRSTTLKTVASVMVGSSLLTAIACGSSADPTGGFDDHLNASGGTSGTSGASGGFSSGASGGTSGASGSSGGKECAAQEAAASLTKTPVDILIAIDNSGSMSGEIAEVEKQINQNFATIIDAAKIDYRVIMLSKHGSNTGQMICVSMPLSGATTCTPPPPQPVETAKFFQHSKFISSFNALCRIVDSFAKPDDFNKHPTGYGALLRPKAAKVILVITDDRVSTGQADGCIKPYDDLNTVAGGGTASTAFENDLLALPGNPFGTAAKRNYTFHSIIGLAPFDAANLTKAHPSTAPVITSKCTPGSQNPGTGYQTLSAKTGGLRYPSCGLNYTTIFQEIAKGVIEGSKVTCEFPVPPAPAGQTLDLSTVVPHYTPGDGSAGKDFQQVPNAGACVADKFYIADGTIKLCPATCDSVQADPKAAIKVLFGCAPKGAN